MSSLTALEASEAIKKTRGNISQAAKRLGVDRSYLHRFINKHPSVKTAVNDAREGMKDFAESKLMEGIEEGNTALIIFYLKTQAKDRGYVERQEVTGAEGSKIEISLDKSLDWDA